METFVDVILPLPLRGLFTYLLPPPLCERVQRGCRVSVPFGNHKTYTAIVEAVHHNRPQGYKLKSVSELLDDAPIMLPRQFDFWQWITRYYLCTLGEVYKAALPQGLKGEYKPRLETRVRLSAPYHEQPAAIRTFLVSLRQSSKQRLAVERYLQMCDAGEADNITKKELLEKLQISPSVWLSLVQKGLFETYEFEVGRLNGKKFEVKPCSLLNEPQQRAYDEIKTAFTSKKVCLLHGVTSSGKTEIYIRLINDMLIEGKQVLYLLPEIALTKQITERLQQVFGNRIGIYHSKYSDAERVEVWKKQLSEQPFDIILGVRSSVFLPFRNLGLVVVDEEHENTYKQQEPAPRYHARNAAIVLASLYGANTLLGTATPSVESYYNALAGKYSLVELTERYQSIELPEIEVVDVKDLKRRKQMNGPFSLPLLAAMRGALERGKQVILFQNRRGYTPMMECNMCGWVPRCKNCDVTLTYHKEADKLTCHYCGYTISAPKVCPACKSTEFVYLGFGTEKIEDDLQKLFPDARLARMDLDTTRSRTSYENIISDFQQGKNNILIGTQMVSKGLDFDDVEVVGILDADSMLNYPDFRASERAFQLMAQVAGRAGRKGKRGRVILQTKSPASPVIAKVVENDYTGFYDSQAEERGLFHYPPFYRLVSIVMRHRDAHLIEQFAMQAAADLRVLFGNRVLGPENPPVARVQQKFIQKILLKEESALSAYKVNERLLQIFERLIKEEKYHSVEFFFDVDPQG